LGSKHVLVVNAEDGLDEISIASETKITELKDGQITCYKISPKQFGIEISNLDDIVVQNVKQSLQMVNDVLNNRSCAATDIVKLNAGAAIYASDKASTLPEGIDMADAAISSGESKNKFEQYIEYTNSLK